METDIKLRKYQQDAIDNIFGRIDENGKKHEGLYDSKRFAAVFLPTGGGKSFVAMEAMNRTMNINKNDNSVISDSSMLYLSPNTAILDQFLIHISQNLISNYHVNKISNEENLSVDDFIEISKDILKNINSNIVFDEKNILKKFQEYNDERNLKPHNREILKSIVNYQLSKQKFDVIEESVKIAFPKLQLKCYQSLESGNNNENKNKEYYKTFDVSKVDADFIILDEAHRGGAKTWGENIKKLVESHPKSKILAITATPDRDFDDESIIKDISLITGYIPSEVRAQKYMAKNLGLIEAIEKGLVVTPKIVTLSCTLDETKPYKEVAKKLGEVKNDGSKRYCYEAILKEMNKIIGREENISDEQWKSLKVQKISQVIKESGLSSNAKCIAFIPKAKKNGKSLKHVQNYEKSISNMLEKSGNQVESVIGYHTVYPESKNRQTLQNFNIAENDFGGQKVIVTNSKLGEGVHVSGTDALFMYDQIYPEDSQENPRIKFMQQIGRCISSIDPEQPELSKQPIIFDFAHNFLWQHDLLKKAKEQPFFNMTYKDSKFLELCDILKKDLKKIEYITNPKTKEKKFIFEYEEKVDNGRKKEKYVYCPYSEEKNREKKKITRPSCKKNSTFFGKNKSKEDRVNTTIKLLEILQKYNIDTSEIDEKMVFSRTFFNANDIKGEKQEELLDSLSKEKDTRSIAENIDKKGYPLGAEMKLIRETFFGVGKSNKTLEKIISKIEFEKLAKLGILSVNLDEIPENLKNCIDSNGFIIPNEKVDERYWGLSTKSGNRFFQGKDRFECLESGYDIYGYDKDGFDKDGIHKITGQEYDERFFKRNKAGEWINILTGKNIDKLGYNHEGIDPDTGFDRGRIDEKGNLKRLWHAKNDDGTFSELGKDEDDDGLDQNGFDKDGKFKIFNESGFRRNGLNDRTNEYYDFDGYNIDGFDKKGFNKDGIHRDTSYECGLDALDQNGDLHPEVKVLEHIYNDLMYAIRKDPPIDAHEVINKYIMYTEKDISGKKKNIDDILGNALTIISLSPQYKDEKFIVRRVKILEPDQLTAIEGICKLSPKFEKIYRKKTEDKCKECQILNEELDRLKAEGKDTLKIDKKIKESEMDFIKRRNEGDAR